MISWNIGLIRRIRGSRCGLLELVVDVFEKGTNYWLIRTKSGEWYDEFVEQNFISIDTNGLKKDELVDLHTKDDIKNMLDKRIEQAITKFVENYNGEKDHTFINKIEKMDISERSKSHTATRINSFCNEIKEGDYIIIPSQSSKTFAIGIVKSEVYESDYDMNEIYSLQFGLTGESQPSYNTLIRDIEWVTFKTRAQIPLKLLNSFLTVHHSIISLNENKFYFQGLINPIFIDEDNKLNMKIEINKEDGLDVNDWKNLYNQLEEIEKFSEAKFKEIKSDVQSPGDITPVIESVSNMWSNLTGTSPYLLAVYSTYRYFSNNPEIVSKIVLRVLPENRAKAKVEKAKYELELSKIEHEKDKFNKDVQKHLKSEVQAITKKDDKPLNKSDD